MGVRHVLGPYLRHPLHAPRMIRWWRAGARSEERHVFVIGAPRSGTTLMHSLLLAHSRLCGFPDETDFFSWRDLLDPKRDLIGLGPEERARVAGDARDVEAFFDGLVARFKASHGVPEQRFVEKTSQHVKRLDFICERFPNAQFVHMVRDGRDACCSALRADIPNIDAVDRFARYWRRCVRARLATRCPDRLLDVAYEALTAGPEDAMRRVMSFLGEAYEPGQIDPSAREDDPRTRAARFAKLSEPISSSSQGVWRTAMTPDQVKRFEAIAGPELTSVGYRLASQDAG